MAEEKLIYNLDGAKLPYSVEAEQAVLGSVLVDPSCLNDIAVQMNRSIFIFLNIKKFMLQWLQCMN